MKAVFAALALAAFLSAPAAAQEGAPPLSGDPRAEDPLAEGLDLLGRGAEGVLRGLLDQVQPGIEGLDRDLRRFAQDLAPILRDLSGMIGDLDRYHPPEMLPNGDILLRRNTPGETERVAPGPPVEGEVEI